MDLGGGFLDASPSHPAQAVSPFPGAGDFLDPTANAMDRLVPGLEPGLCFLFGTGPDAEGDNARRSALGADCAAEMRSAIGTVGKDLARIVGQRRQARPYTGLISGSEPVFACLTRWLRLLARRVWSNWPRTGSRASRSLTGAFLRARGGGFSGSKSRQ